MTPTVETSVAVAIPLMTKKRMTNGKVRPGTAIAKVRAISATGARAPAPTSEPRERHHATKTSASAATKAGKRPPVNRAAIDSPGTTEPIVISTRLGGMVSDIALDVASSDESSPGCSAGSVDGAYLRDRGAWPDLAVRHPLLRH